MVPPGIRDDTVDVWWVRRGQYDWQHLTGLLDHGERTRLERYRRAEDQERFVLAAALARAALAQRLGTAPGEVALDRTCTTCAAPHGKPRLAHPAGEFELSVTHSGELVGVAVADRIPVGLDVEALDRRLDSATLEAGVLAPSERAALQRAVTGTGDPEARATAFLQLWTRKEALTKMVGRGITVPLGQVVVSGPDETPRCLGWPDGDLCPDDVALFDVTVPVPGHVAALAAHRRIVQTVVNDGGTLIATLA